MKLKLKQILSKTSKSILLIRLPYFTKNVLLVRLDFVGDYILFRNGLNTIKNSERFKGYKFTLLGNIAFKDIAERFDNNVFDKFIWIDPKILSSGFRKILLLIKLKLNAYHAIINPTLSLTIRTDLFVKYLNAKVTIGSKRSEINSFTSFDEDKNLSESCYTELIDIPDNSNFEFFRNIKFVENLTNTINPYSNLELPTSKKKETVHSSTIKIILVPGASREYRRWSTENFALLIRKLHELYNLNCVFYLTGSKGETSLGEQILHYISDTPIKITNLVGKTNLIETIELINDSTLVISNETGTIHIAAAVKTPAVCISNGNDFGRFNPYPSSLTNNIITLYPNDTFYKEEFYHSNVKKHVESNLNINEITIQEVFNAAKSLLEKISSHSFRQ